MPEDDAGVEHEQLQQVELRLRELDLALTAPGATRPWVEPQVGDHERGGHICTGLRPTEERADPRQQLVEFEGLGQVVVGPGIEPGHPVRRPCRQQQDRHAVSLRAQHPADGQPVDARHHHVQHQQVERCVPDGLERRCAVGHERDGIALEFQRPAEGLPDRPVIVGHQDPCPHGPMLAPPGKSRVRPDAVATDRVLPHSSITWIRSVTTASVPVDAESVQARTLDRPLRWPTVSSEPGRASNKWDRCWSRLEVGAIDGDGRHRIGVASHSVELEDDPSAVRGANA